MAEAGSFAERVKQSADIVRLIGEYVRLKKSGQNFIGLCPFHPEKTPSFAVHPVKQIYHCFGCGVGGDIFKFVMEMEKCAFPEAVRVVAEKAGMAVPQMRERSPEERQANQQRAALCEMHSLAAQFFVRQLETPEGQVARAYLEERGLGEAAITRFVLGYAPSNGDALHRFLKPKFSDKLLQLSGLILRDAGGHPYDRFRRRVMFPIANESGKVIAFGGRALGDDPPKYMNSPETPIYSKSSVLYHLDRAKEAVRQAQSAVLVEGYMDTIAVACGGIGNVVASCGTSLAEPQVKLLSRYARQVVVNYDPDAAGQAATDRSLALLLEKEFEIRVLVLPRGADPDKFIREQGPEAYRKLLAEAPAYLDYLLSRARAMDRSTAQGKLATLNFLMPYVQRIPNRIVRSEWASRIASELRIDEPVLREALRRAANERKSEVRPKAEFLGPAIRPAERRLMRMLVDAEGFREKLASTIAASALHRGLEGEPIFGVLLETAARGEPIDVASLAEALEEKHRRLFFEVVFESAPEATWEEAQDCMAALQRRRVESQLAELQIRLEARPDPSELRELLGRKQELSRQLAHLRPQ